MLLIDSPNLIKFFLRLSKSVILYEKCRLYFTRSYSTYSWWSPLYLSRPRLSSLWTMQTLPEPGCLFQKVKLFCLSEGVNEADSRVMAWGVSAFPMTPYTPYTLYTSRKCPHWHWIDPVQPWSLKDLHVVSSPPACASVLLMAPLCAAVLSSLWISSHFSTVFPLLFTLSIIGNEMNISSV